MSWQDEELSRRKQEREDAEKRAKEWEIQARESKIAKDKLELARTEPIVDFWNELKRQNNLLHSEFKLNLTSKDSEEILKSKNGKFISFNNKIINGKYEDRHEEISFYIHYYEQTGHLIGTIRSVSYREYEKFHDGDRWKTRDYGDSVTRYHKISFDDGDTLLRNICTGRGIFENILVTNDPNKKSIFARFFK